MNQEEYIEVMTEEQWREHYNMVWRGEARARQNRWNKKHAEDRARRKYFCKQRFGGLIEIIAVLLVTPLIGNYAFLAMTLPGIVLMTTKQMLLINEYYWTHGGNDQWED